MARRPRSRSGAHTECPECGKRLRGEKGLAAHMRNEHGKNPPKPQTPERPSK